MISKEQLKSLVETVSIKTGKSQEQMAGEMGYGSNYISEILSPSGKITHKFLNNFNLRYKSILDNPKFHVEIPKKEKSPEKSSENTTVQELSRAILVISESNKGLVDQHQSIIEANRVIANTNQVLAQKIISDPFMKNDGSGKSEVAFAIIPKVLDLMAEIGVGNLWQTKEEGLAEIGRRLNVPSVVKENEDHNVSDVSKKRTA